MAGKQVQYFDKSAEKRALAEIEAMKARPQTRHVDFLMDRKRPPIPNPADIPRKSMTVEQVVKQAETGLTTKSAAYFKQLTDWRPDLQLKRFEQVKVLDEVPHLGYAAITRGSFPDKDRSEMPWAFYFANFNARFGKGDALFEDIPTVYGVTFFALALELAPDGQIIGRDTRKRGNGLLFSTADLKEAFETVAKLRQLQISWQTAMNSQAAQS